MTEITINTLRELREHCGHTQQTIADVLGCDQATVSRYEQNPNNMHASDIEKLSSFYGIKPDDIAALCRGNYMDHLRSKGRSEVNENKSMVLDLLREIINEAERHEDWQERLTIKNIDFTTFGDYDELMSVLNGKEFEIFWSAEKIDLLFDNLDQMVIDGLIEYMYDTLEDAAGNGFSSAVVNGTDNPYKNTELKSVSSHYYCELAKGPVIYDPDALYYVGRSTIDLHLFYDVSRTSDNRELMLFYDGRSINIKNWDIGSREQSDGSVEKPIVVGTISDNTATVVHHLQSLLVRKNKSKK